MELTLTNQWVYSDKIHTHIKDGVIYAQQNKRQATF